MKTRAIRIAPVLFSAAIACAAVAAATNLATAQELGSPGDRVEVTWGGKPTMAKIDRCTSTACYLYLYDNVLGRWSDGTIYWVKSEIRGLKNAVHADAPAPNAAAAPPAQVQGQWAVAAPARIAAAPAPVQARTVAAAGAGAIPAGHYACDFAGGGSAGYVDIRGNAYRGPTLDKSGDFKPYAMGAGNSITWTAGFGEFKVVSSQFMGGDTSGRPWFAVTYSRTRGGGVDRLDCLRQ
jgi:hypothetical protein